MNDPAAPNIRDLATLLVESMTAGEDGADAALAVEREVYARSAVGAAQHYVLLGRETAPASIEAYVAWRRTVGWPCRIASTEIGVSLVSSEFLGLDLRPDELGLPVLFQVSVCSDVQDFDGLSWGARSYAEALEVHERVTRALERGHEGMAALLDECAM